MPDGLARSYCGMQRGRVTKNPHGDAPHAATRALLGHSRRPADRSTRRSDSLRRSKASGRTRLEPGAQTPPRLRLRSRDGTAYGESPTVCRPTVLCLSRLARVAYGWPWAADPQSSASRPVDSPVALPAAHQSIWVNSRWSLPLKQRRVSASGRVTAPPTASLQRSAVRRPASQQPPAQLARPARGGRMRPYRFGKQSPAGR
jgi:hypothetical protein